jgi:universal stress protein A
MLKPTKILVPTDFSEFSDKALRQGLDIAVQYNAELYAVHVISGEVTQCVDDYCLAFEQVKALEDQMYVAAQEKLRQELERLPQTKQVKVSSDVRRGVSYEEILKEAEEKGVDLIVIASLGRTGLAKYLIGSVARNVLKRAKCPVLLTK